jgi:GntR family transcriptional repressor for pyruvate dehydrogenase complex
VSEKAGTENESASIMKARRAEKTTWKPSKMLARGNASERLLDDLRERILSGQIERGAKLPTEKELAAAYGVSGATVREAVRGLATAKLLEVRHGSGAYVTAHVDQLMGTSLRSIIQVERITMPHVLAVQAEVSTFAAELAATHASKADIAKMQRAQNDMQEAKTLEALSGALVRYQDALSQASGNPLLAALCHFLVGMQVGLATELSGGSYATRRRSVAKLADDRQALIDAVKSGDPQVAREAAHQYNSHAMTVLSALPDAGKNRVADPALSNLLASLLHP